MVRNVVMLKNVTNKKSKFYVGDIFDSAYYREKILKKKEYSSVYTHVLSVIPKKLRYFVIGMSSNKKEISRFQYRWMYKCRALFDIIISMPSVTGDKLVLEENVYEKIKSHFQKKKNFMSF